MVIRLLADDSKYPNLAIMKISTYHKRLGDDVAWYDPTDFYDKFNTDILYHSRIFNFTPPYKYYPLSGKIIRGGSGFNIESKLPEEIESITELDYSLYPNCDYSIMFTTRGCIRQCPFCIVRKKEGLIHNIPLCSLNPNGKYIKILDNNFFASSDWKSNLQKLKEFNQPLEFNGGIDLRLLTREQCEELQKCKIKSIHCAWDNYKDKNIILPKLKMLIEYIKPYKILCYALIGFENKDLQETDIERVNTIWSLGVYPFVMVYQDFNNPQYKPNKICKDFQRWCNNRFIFKSCKWEDYKKGLNNGSIL